MARSGTGADPTTGAPSPLTIPAKLFLVLADLLFVLAALLLGLLIRFEGVEIPFRFLVDHLLFYGAAILFCLAVYWASGLYEKIWRYAGVHELVNIFRSVSISFVPMALGAYASGGRFYPRSAIFVAWLLALLLVGGTRFLLRLSSEAPPSGRPGGKRVLIVGANDAGESVLREMLRHPDPGYSPVGFVDGDPGKRSLRIHGVPVLGTQEDLPRLVAEKGIQEVVVSLPSPSLVRDVVDRCRNLKVGLKTVPPLSQILDGKVKASELREVQIEDLLERAPVRLDLERAASFLKGKVVLVTGAGGSIGAEICRQVAGLGPSLLVLAGRGENSLYEIELEMRTRVAMPLVTFVGDIRDGARMEVLFSRYSPVVVFHAAAHKHVPLMEENVAEALSNNVLGTHRLLEAAHRHQVERFILLSTDKAVNPSSVMGASKRLAEKVLGLWAERSSTQFVAVRFGNVLDSRGSVVPTFRRQIALGGPVTVTHPEMTRYFMTIPEAVQLVIQAGALGGRGEIYLLDMGSPVRILDLARNMIRLSGLEPDKDIPIRILGVRLGEKLTEELLGGQEASVPTGVPKIGRVTAPLPADGEMEAALAELEALLPSGDETRLLEFLIRRVPEYRPSRGAPSSASS